MKQSKNFAMRQFLMRNKEIFKNDVVHHTHKIYAVYRQKSPWPSVAAKHTARFVEMFCLRTTKPATFRRANRNVSTRNKMLICFMLGPRHA